MKKKLQPTVGYHVSFETEHTPGYLVSVKVSIGHAIHSADEGNNKLRIDLADHPLYKDLQAYVLANPR